MSNFNYYQYELTQAETKNNITELTPLKLKITGDSFSTKWLTLNKESIKEIRLFLDKIEND
jgi:hypothetical protein